MSAPGRIVYVLDLCRPEALKTVGEVGTWRAATTGVVIRCEVGSVYYDGRARALELWREPHGPFSPEEIRGIRQVILPQVRKRVREFAVNPWGCFHQIRLRKPGVMPLLVLDANLTSVKVITGP